MNYCTFCRKSDPLKRLSSREITGPVTRNHEIFKTVGRVEDEQGPSHSGMHNIVGARSRDYSRSVTIF